MLKKVSTLLALVLVLSSGLYAQDPQFSQFSSMPMNVNPAMAGVAYGPRFNLVYRNEWPKIDKGFVTYGLSYDQHIDKLNSGVGVLFLYDRVAGGILNNYHLRVNYAYSLQFNKGFGLQIGLYGGYIGRTVNWGQLYFNDQIDPVFGFENFAGIPNPTTEPTPQSENIHLFDAGAGFLLYSRKVYGGISFSHITTPKEAFTSNDEEFRLPLKVNIHTGVDIDLTPKKRNSYNKLSPAAQFTVQGSAIALNMGSYLSIDKFFMGAFYRHNIRNNDAVIGLVGVKIEFVRVAYSYDVTLSKLAVQGSGGAHEVTFSINFGGDNGPLDPKYKAKRLSCPSALSF